MNVKSDFADSPEDWRICELGELATYVGSGITPTGGSRVYRATGRPLVRSQNVGWGRLLLDDVAFIDDETHSTFATTELRAGDVLLNITGASIGRSAVADTRIAGGNVNQHVCIIRPKASELISGYLNAILLHDIGQRQIDGFQAGGNRQGLNFGQVQRIRVPMPASLFEQRAIAAALSDVDALLDGLTRLIAKKRDLKQAAMQQLLTGRTRLPGFNDTWQAKRLSDEISDLIAGVSVRSVESDSPDALMGPGILKTSAVNGGRFLPDEAKPIAPSEARRVSLAPRADTVLISRMNTIELVGECGYVESDYANRFIPDRIWMTQFRPDATISAKWLAYTLTSESAREKVRGIATGTSGSMKNISKSAFLGLYFDVPPLAEQIAIAKVLSDMDAELAALEARHAKTQALKQAMMQALLTGRIRLVSPEPAHA